MDINMIGICKAFGTNKVLGGVNLHIRPGEVHALDGGEWRRQIHINEYFDGHP